MAESTRSKSKDREETENINLADLIKQLSAQINSVNTQINEVKSELKTDMNTLKTDNANLKTQINTNLHAQINTIHTDFERFEHHLTELNSKYQNKQEQERDQFNGELEEVELLLNSNINPEEYDVNSVRELDTDNSEAIVDKMKKIDYVGMVEMVGKIDQLENIDRDDVNKTREDINNSLNYIEKFDKKSQQRDGLNDKDSVGQEELDKDNGKLEVEVKLINSVISLKREPLELDIKEGDAIILEEKLHILNRSKDEDEFKQRMICSPLIKTIQRERSSFVSKKRDKPVQLLKLVNKWRYEFQNLKGRNDSIIKNLRKLRKIFNFKSARKKKKINTTESASITQIS
jgi:hypothetical protein